MIEIDDPNSDTQSCTWLLRLLILYSLVINKSLNSLAIYKVLSFSRGSGTRLQCIAVAQWMILNTDFLLVVDASCSVECWRARAI